MASNGNSDSGCLAYIFLIVTAYLFIKAYPIILLYVALGVAGIWLSVKWFREARGKAEENKKELRMREKKALDAAREEVKRVMGVNGLAELHSIVRKVAHEKAILDTYYTNTEFTERMEKFIPKFERAYEVYKKIIYDTHISLGRLDAKDWAENPYSIYKGHKKGFDGEERVKEELIDSGIDFMESVNLRNGDFQIEVDFMIVVGDTIVTLEVKDYSAEEIILDDSGEMYKVVRGKEVPVENVLPQINRHKRFIRENFPKGTQVINLIVLSDKRTVVKNRIREDDIRLIVPHYVANIVDKLCADNKEMEKAIRGRVEELRAAERKFKFFNVEEMERELESAFYKEDSAFNVFLKQHLRSDATELAVNTLKAKFRDEIGYGIEKSNHRGYAVVYLDSNMERDINSVRQVAEGLGLVAE